MTDINFFERLRQNPHPVVVDFWAPWCGPCRSIEPALKKLGQEYNGRVDVWRVNADEQPELLRQLRIYGIPTLIAYRSGEEVIRHTGAPSSAGLKSLFEAGLSGTPPTTPLISPLERFLRLGAGVFLFALGYFGNFAGWYLGLAVLGGIIMFSAVRDRCPIWQAIAPRLQALLQPDSQKHDPTA